MCKKITFIACIFLLLISCKTQPLLNTDNETEFWRDGYAVFLRNLPVLGDNMIFSFFLRDLDNSGVPELMIVQMNQTAHDDVLTAYSYDGEVYKIGDYSNPKKSFTDWFRFSNSPAFPGLFECWVGGGVEHYGYLSVKEGKLTYEYLWYDDRTKEPPQQIEISGNKLLIDESIDAFPPYDYTDNLLETYLVNDNNIDGIISLSP